MDLIYSVTTTIEKDSALEWATWMVQEHIPAVVATGCFTGYQFHRVIEPATDAGMATYNVLYDCASPSAYDVYIKQHAHALRAAAEKKFGGRYHAFRTVLQRL